MKRTERGQRQSITHEGYVVHCYVRSDGLGGCVTTDMEYPSRVAFVLLGQLLEDFTAAHGDAWKTCTVPESIAFAKIDEYLQKYQDPKSADKIAKIQSDLDETTQILRKWYSKASLPLSFLVNYKNKRHRSDFPSHDVLCTIFVCFGFVSCTL